MESTLVGVKLLFTVSQISLAYGESFVLGRKTAITKPLEGFRLRGRIITELKTVSMMTCTQKCLRDSTCQSTNVEIINAEDFPIVHVCHLMSDNLDGMDNALIKGSGWIYSDVEVSNV